ncbi:hypothetical protein OG824_31770 [Streptomyces prunicolor]|uniref:hypothetical protein n=1 Tax=Streptomyces prunicolor TaxID=67348 RepID=UPI0022505ADF|nr:hypothetical protein [Streptomyces prunicolor]MCX5239789.1 hypothetical protein [Streptomyces prunicolor]
MPSFTHVIAGISAVCLGLYAAVYAALATRRTARLAPVYCAGCALAAVLLAAYGVGGRR